jgi:flagellar hook protein FlgE
MLNSLTSGVSGLVNFQEQMDVIGNNIANVDTPGYKAQRTEFADAFSDTLQVATAATASTPGEATIQLGTGVTTTAVTSNWSAGAPTATGISSDLAVTSGDGFFIVRDAVTNQQFATQAGNFQVNSLGYLVTPTGQRVQGFTTPGSGTVGDMRITTDPNKTGVSEVSYSIDSSGNINVLQSDGTTYVSGQIGLNGFADPEALESVGNNLYANMSAAGPVSATLGTANTNGLGTIQSDALEASNVDLSNEMANLIVAQRSFEANSKIITSSDELLQTVVNMIR